MSVPDDGRLGHLYAYPFDMQMPLYSYIWIIRLLRQVQPVSEADRQRLEKFLSRADATVCNYLDSYMSVLNQEADGE